MEKHYYICDHCKKEIIEKCDQDKMVTLCQDYTYHQYSMGDYMGEKHHHECYHLCSECFEKFKKKWL